MKIALVHDDLAQQGGAEQVLAVMQTIWPDAPVFTTLAATRHTLANTQTSFMQYFPLKKYLYRWYFPFYPLAVETFDLHGFDLVIASSSRFAHGVLTKPNTMLVWYCHTPSRIAWGSHRHFSHAWLAVLSVWLSYIRMWDWAAVTRTNAIIANSLYTKQRIRMLFGKEAYVVYPFVDTEFFTINGRETQSFFLIVSRLVVHKHIDRAITACNALGKHLVVVGTGPDMRRLCALAGPTVQLVGRLTKKSLLEYYRQCSALIVPGEEDFGMVALEALACGKPVIAANCGGITEIVRNEKTGILFSESDQASLMCALNDFQSNVFDSAACRARALNFSKKLFEKNLLATIDTIMKKESRASKA